MVAGGENERNKAGGEGKHDVPVIAFVGWEYSFESLQELLVLRVVAQLALVQHVSRHNHSVRLQQQRSPPHGTAQSPVAPHCKAALEDKLALARCVLSAVT
jgi:hypothetical protein